eukprot:TRINITY_DN16404_c0_g1_i1.p2 TRINITY_DN16404_c0_g1~~TRINITY_DN16404_c0_g1_i1.p2  ORF type:complete len:159 (+),score=24.42 TRINITY_DN16404_c0_g1_i1:122-598(+)
MASCTLLRSGALGSLALSQCGALESQRQTTCWFQPPPFRLGQTAGTACSTSRLGERRHVLLREGRRASGMQNGSRRGPTVCGIFGLGVPELVVIAGVAAVLFGPKQLPELGKSLGKTVKSFQQAAKEFEGEIKKNAEELKEEAQNSVDEFKKEVGKEK